MTTTTMAPPLHASSARPVVAWAVAGAGFWILEITVFARWMLSDDFRPVDPGPDPVPWITTRLATLFQVLNVAVGLACIGWAVRRCWRERRVDTTLLFVLAWWSCLWQDALANYFRLTFTYNSHMVNMGSWYRFIPGWVQPNMQNFAEPLVFIVGCYVSWVPLQCLFCAWLMRKAKTRWPRTGTAGLLAVGFVAMLAADFLFEGLWVRTGLYSFSGAVRSWSLWGGTVHQFPIYNALLWAPVMVAGGALYYFRDDRGQVAVERGAETLRHPATRHLLRFLAISAYFNVLMIVYAVAMGVISFSMDATPPLPSYLANGICGKGTGYPCPAPNLPVPLPGSGPLDPDY